MANYPFATIDPNVGMVEVPDKRLDRIQELIPAKKVVPTTFEFTDIAGIVKGASKGEGLGNKFLEISVKLTRLSTLSGHSMTTTSPRFQGKWIHLTTSKQSTLNWGLLTLIRLISVWARFNEQLRAMTRKPKRNWPCLKRLSRSWKTAVRFAKLNLLMMSKNR